ncbi:MAG: tRNA 2-thiouridine(34) synthase MnmA [bacterium]
MTIDIPNKEIPSASPARRGVVAVAMSGGVDSSLTALLLAEQGYEVMGFTLLLHDEGDGISAEGAGRERRCCAATGAARARQAALRAGGWHRVLDAREAFRASVMEDFKRQYALGRTPNPCVRCNTYVKWGLLIEHARRLGADWFATGHHARVVREGGHTLLKRGADRQKDQGYALWGIPRRSLERTLLPVGELDKSRVRELAGRWGLAAAGVPDSQEICFIPSDDYRHFLRDRVRRDREAGSLDEELERALRPGEIVDEEGKVVGRHDGTALYTVGQRRGLGVAAGRRLYVHATDPERGTVRIGGEEGLLTPSLTASGANWVSIDPPAEPFRADVQIRYNGTPAAARIDPAGSGTFRVLFDGPQRAVTPGQSAVLFDGDVVLGGGVIESVP